MKVRQHSNFEIGGRTIGMKKSALLARARMQFRVVHQQLDTLPRKEPATLLDAFNQHRQAQSQRARTLAMMLLPLDAEG